ncbi:glutamine amidotransferase [Fodinibacter luteus]|uniref:Lipid II isoglutaminyl synthase (glutamine-hydrolyzing) subunit GatD n=1 Tax=Fodinibacter luteus TaxID=552064 RepID=A0ABP8JZ30_9MICO
MSPLRIAVLHPLATAAQGDEGNARVLARRADLRGIRSTVTWVHQGAVPEADIYLVGGLDDDRMPVLAQRLRAGGLAERVSGGAVVLAVNAGYQVLGHSYVAPDGARHAGLGLIDVRSSRSTSPFLGPVITRPDPALGLAALSGYESHHGTTDVGPGAVAFVALELGHGNDGEHDGARQGHIIGTYVHGPLLARNADLADLLLIWGTGAPLVDAPSPTADALRSQRITEDRADPTGWGGRVYGRARRRSRPRLGTRGS